jgi:hypothetical protein
VGLWVYYKSRYTTGAVRRNGSGWWGGGVNGSDCARSSFTTGERRSLEQSGSSRGGGGGALGAAGGRDVDWRRHSVGADELVLARGSEPTRVDASGLAAWAAGPPVEAPPPRRRPSSPGGGASWGDLEYDENKVYQLQVLCQA